MFCIPAVLITFQNIFIPLTFNCTILLQSNIINLYLQYTYIDLTDNLTSGYSLGIYNYIRNII